jgi:hypothetical protein
LCDQSISPVGSVATTVAVIQGPLSVDQVDQVARIAQLIEPFVAAVDPLGVPGALSVGLSFVVWDAATAVVRARYVVQEAA